MRVRLLGILLVLTSVSATAEPIRIATWNLMNLHFVVGEPLRARAVARTEADYEMLRKYRDLLNADVVALQEVNGPKAARRVFDESAYELRFSGRYADDLATGRDTDHIYTGFAVRRGVFDSIVKRDVPELGVRTGGDPSRPVRWGTELTLERGGRVLRLLAVHLKSGCHQGNLVAPRSDACDTLARQRAPLEAWIDRAAREKLPFLVLGDFNRRFDVYGARDHLWGEVDDGFPPGLDLHRLPDGQPSPCWEGSSHHFVHPIDFIVFDQRAAAWVDPASFRILDYAPADRDESRETPSDHCPLVVELKW